MHTPYFRRWNWNTLYNLTAITTHSILFILLNHTELFPFLHACPYFIVCCVSHVTCWGWAVPDSVIGQWVPALQGLLGFHGWRSCGQTVERQWSPHRSPPHPSSLTHLTIAGPGTHSSTHLPHEHRHIHKLTCTTFYRQMTEMKRICAVYPKQFHMMDHQYMLTWRKWHSDTHALIQYIPPSFYFMT